MSFLVPLGLLVALAVAGPLLAHLLRRRLPEERVFPPARLVPTAPPVARRRANFEDRALLSLRAIAVLILALLAASPLVRCTRLSLNRHGGASVALAIVIDDSMSMNAKLPKSARRDGATTRFELALVAARELAASLRSGDSTVIVLAGAPPRVALAPTGDASSVRNAIEQLARDGGSDAGTDLDAAVSLAASTLRELPQPDRRIVLLSDLADGTVGAKALALPDAAGAAERMTLEAPLDALRLPPPEGAVDCAVLSATPEGGTDAIRVRLACALGGAPVGNRAVEIVHADAAHARVGIAAFPPAPPAAPNTFDVLVAVDRSKAPTLGVAAAKPSLLARITGETDALSRDDVAPVLGAATAPAIAVVVGEGGALDEVVATGGAPLLERAFNALESGLAIRPIPAVPDREIDLAPYAGLAIDDPSGLGPESREAIGKWLEKGGVLLLALGPHGASPPLGNSFEPLLRRNIRWEKLGPSTGVTSPAASSATPGKDGRAVLGVDPAAAGPLGEGASAPVDLSPAGRTTLDREDLDRLAVVSAWKDGAPLIATRAIGQGESWLVLLPFAPEISALPLRPSFLALLDAFATRVRDRGAGARLEVGRAWTAGADDTLEVQPLDDAGNPRVAIGGARLNDVVVQTERTPDARRARPRSIGAYLVTVAPHGGELRKDVRAVSPVPREVNLSARELDVSIAAGAKSGLQRTTTELAPTLALILSLLAAIELAVRAHRVWGGRRERDAVASSPPG